MATVETVPPNPEQDQTELTSSGSTSLSQTTEPPPLVSSQTGSPPPAGEPSPTSASPGGLKRPSKAAQACDNCKRSHLKCDGEPICARCKKLDYNCSYSDSKKRGPKPSSGSQSLSRRDVQQNNLQQLLFLNARLEQEIKHLQSQVAFWEAKYRLAENILLQQQPTLPPLPPPTGLQYHPPSSLPGGNVPSLTHLHHQQNQGAPAQGPTPPNYIGHNQPSSYPSYPPSMNPSPHGEPESSRPNQHHPEWRETS